MLIVEDARDDSGRFQQLNVSVVTSYEEERSTQRSRLALTRTVKISSSDTSSTQDAEFGQGRMCRVRKGGHTRAGLQRDTCHYCAWGHSCCDALYSNSGVELGIIVGTRVLVEARRIAC